MATLYRAEHRHSHAAPPAPPSFDPALCPPVSVDGTVIPLEDIVREAQLHPAASPAEAWAEASRALAVRTLLLDEARRLGLMADPQEDGEGRRETDEEALVRQLLEREVVTPEPDADVCRRYYERNAHRFRSRDLIEASHILLAARPAEPDPVASARRLAGHILAVLKERPAAFAELAREHSACPSGAAGGNLGQIGPGDTTPPFEEALARLEPGNMTTEPVETRYGLHIVRLDRRIEGRQLPFEVVEGRIASYLSERSRRQAIAQYLARLASHARIEGVALPTAADLRVA